jgi:hypothetical protein
MRGRGVQTADIDDILQEVAIRALRDQGRFTSTEHMVRWCCRVAINLHIDVTRRGRKVSPEPLQEAATHQNVAEAVESRLALDAVFAQMAGLSPEDRRLLLYPTQADSRKEAVRLAVRRHRLRARLAALLEGTLAGLAVLRRALRNESVPSRVALVAVPVVAVLVAIPLVSHPGARHAGGVDPAARTVLEASRWQGGSTAAGAAPRSAAARPAGLPASDAYARSLVVIRPAGRRVHIDEEQHPDDTPTACIYGHVNYCIDRPGPVIGAPKLPPIPLIP